MATTTNVFQFLFHTEDIQVVAGDDPDFVLVTCSLDIVQVNGKSVAVVNVHADSCMDSSSDTTTTDPYTVVHSVAGCPVPPCIPGGGSGSDGCDQEVQDMMDFIKDKLL